MFRVTGRGVSQSEPIGSYHFRRGVNSKWLFMANQLQFDDLLNRAVVDPVAMVRLAGVLSNMGHAERAREVARRALTAAPHNAQVWNRASDILSRRVPRWHFSIVQDQARNDAYEAALKRAVTTKSKVLEIGTGSGILAMMAARAGADLVITCEAMSAVAEVAQDIIALNGCAERVRLIAKNSFDLDADEDLGGPADILVSELVSNSMLGQGVLAVIEHAARALLKPGARVIPARGRVRVALAHYDDIRPMRMGTIAGFDLTPFNRLAGNSFQIARGSAGLRLLSQPADLFDFDFQSGGPFPPLSRTAKVTSRGGPANGVAQWIALQMDEEVCYENDPMPEAKSTWGIVFWPFSAPRHCSPGTTVEISGSHDRRNLWVWA